MEFQITCGSGLGFDQFLVQGYCGGQAAAASSKGAFVFDCERRELVKDYAEVVGGSGKKRGSSVKSVEALKSHSDAERRRRERINAHLATLRGLVPSTTDKMDKAAILAEVITQVRQLKKQAIKAAAGLIIPLDCDEVRVQPLEDRVKEGIFQFKASICCSYRPELLSDLKQALNGLKLHTEQAEMSMLGGRVKNEFVLSVTRDGKSIKSDIQAAIHHALTSVLEKAAPLQAYSPHTSAQSKKRKLS